MRAAVALMEFSLSDLWGSHLRSSNFTSCEEILSTKEGRRTALRCMFDTVSPSWSESLCTPAKIVAAIRRLEELQCPNTAEVIILWAWTVGVVSTVDCDGWGLIERNTLDFYRTRGIRRLIALSRHITDTTMETRHAKFLLYHRDPLCLVESIRHPVPVGRVVQPLEHRDREDLRIAQACQLRRLYHLLGYDFITWKEAAVGEAGERVDASPGRSVTPAQFMD